MANRNKRNKVSKRFYTQTIETNKGIAKDANEKVTKTIVQEYHRKKKGRTLGDMVYESYRV